MAPHSAAVLSILSACAAVDLMGLAGVHSTSDRKAEAGARLVTAQRIKAGENDTLMPAALSDDGRLIAFVSRNQWASSRPCCQNVSVLDVATGRITRESIAANGGWPDGDSQKPSLSSDGRILAFETVASNLIAGSRRTGSHRVVVRDRSTGILRTLDDSLPEEPTSATSEPSVAGSGRAVAFTSGATNLVPGVDLNGERTDVYLWRLEDSTIVRVSVDSNVAQSATGASGTPSVSRDGALVAFVSTARLAPEDTNDTADVYLRDLRRGLTLLVSAGIDGKPADGPSHSPALSADGRYVAFASRARNLGPRDRNEESDVYVYDMASGRIALVSATSKGEAANASSGRPAISADGGQIVFQSVASNLGSRPGCPPRVPDRNLLPDVYLFDRTSGCITRVRGSSTLEWWTPSVAPAISGSGTVVAFSSTEPIGEDDDSTDFDLFVFVRPQPERRRARIADWFHHERDTASTHEFLSRSTGAGPLLPGCLGDLQRHVECSPERARLRCLASPGAGRTLGRSGRRDLQTRVR